jgi:uncharacterized integral membrane protein (TIGR00697 family)
VSDQTPDDVPADPTDPAHPAPSEVSSTRPAASEPPSGTVVGDSVVVDLTPTGLAQALARHHAVTPPNPAGGDSDDEPIGQAMTSEADVPSIPGNPVIDLTEPDAYRSGADHRGATPVHSPGPDRRVARASGEVTVGTVALVSIGVYVGAQVISQVTSLKIGTVADRAVDMGTFIYPITFTLRDIIHKAAGRRAARIAIWTSAGVNLFLAAYLAWAAAWPTDPSYPLGAEYSAVLGPLWRIVIASLLAMVVSELIDTEVYHWWVTRITTRFQWLRVLVSNAISVPVDNLIFAVGAFAPLFFLSQYQRDQSLPWDVVWDIFWVNLVVKGLVSLASIPFIYLTKDRHLDQA